MADVTVADETQAKEWITQHPGQARILKTTRPVPGGMNMVVRKDFCADRMRPSRRVGQLARRRDSRHRPLPPCLGRRSAPVHLCRFARHHHAGFAQGRDACQRRRGGRAGQAGRDAGRHALAEGIRQRARARRDPGPVHREEPEGNRLRRVEGRLLGAEDDRQGKAGRLPVQRTGVLEVVQGVEDGRGRRLHQDLLVPRRHARVAREAPAGRRHGRRGAGQAADAGGAGGSRQDGRHRAARAGAPARARGADRRRARPARC